MIYDDTEKSPVHLIGLIASLIFIVLVTGCSPDYEIELPAGSYEYIYQFRDPSKQENFIQELEQRNLPHVVDDHGFVMHMLIDHAEVLGIYRSIKHGGKNQSDETDFSESLSFSSHPESQEKKLRFLAELNSRGIHYRRSGNRDSSYVYWRTKDGPQVDQIRQDVECSLRTERAELYYRDEGLPFDPEACRPYK